MICPAKEILDLVRKDPFVRQPARPDITRFVSIAAKALRVGIRFDLPQIFSASPAPTWLVKIIAIQGRFVLGLYRRQMKAISYLGKIEKRLGVPATTRNWNTIEKVVKTLGDQ